MRLGGAGIGWDRIGTTPDGRWAQSDLDHQGVKTLPLERSEA